jgi:hypothetical protein
LLPLRGIGIPATYAVARVIERSERLIPHHLQVFDLGQHSRNEALDLILSAVLLQPRRDVGAFGFSNGQVSFFDSSLYQLPA